METQKAISALYALAQHARLEIVRLLLASDEEGLAAGVIGQRLGLPPATLSFHLTQLTQAGLITARRKSRSIFYISNFKTITDVVQFLIDNCCKSKDGFAIQTEKPRLKLRLKSDDLAK